MQPFHISDSLLVLVGAVTGTTPTCSIQLQESPTGTGSWSNLGAAIALTNASANSIITQLSLRTYGYLQAVLTVAGTSPSFQLAIVPIEAPKQETNASGFSRSPSS